MSRGTVGKKKRAPKKRVARYDVTFTMEVEVRGDDDLTGINMLLEVENAAAVIMATQKRTAFGDLTIVDVDDVGATFVEEVR